jgi:hypothetical protein
MGNWRDGWIEKEENECADTMDVCRGRDIDLHGS